MKYEIRTSIDQRITTLIRAKKRGLRWAFQGRGRKSTDMVSIENAIEDLKDRKAAGHLNP
jgi:hypothetical protein